jgi:hypothetical protein
MRLMSFRLTVEQMRARTKTVTRRFGWWGLKAGDLVQPVLKAQGIPKGGHVEKIGEPIRVLSTRVERLDAIAADECRREGFPELTPAEFVVMLCVHTGCCSADLVNRIEFEFTACDGCPLKGPLCSDDPQVREFCVETSSE